MPSPLTVQQIALYMSKRRAGSRQEVAAAAAGISVSSAHRIDSGRLQPNAAKPRSRRRPDPLAEVWEPLLLPLLERHPALTPTTLLEHLQEQKPDQDWTFAKRTLQRRVQHWKALHGPAPAVMFPLAYQPGEIGFCDFTKVKRVEITLRGEPFPHLLFHYLPGVNYVGGSRQLRRRVGAPLPLPWQGERPRLVTERLAGNWRLVRTTNQPVAVPPTRRARLRR